MAVQAVVWDIGNVLVEWVPERVYDPLVGRAERDRLFHRVGLHDMNLAVDAGAPFRASVEALAARHPDEAPLIRLWHDRWADMFGPVIDGSVRLLRALRARGVPCLALSNFGRETFDMAQATHPFLAEFDRRYISGHLGVIKPDPAIYAHVEADLGLPPGALIFVDDKAENVEAARARGWQGHVFDGVAGWADRLVAEGLLTREEVLP
ncbi:MAG: HAD family phosphatase [Rhodobacterales bacterium]|nr:HAD family phosphatase [Rhodobacterales bacterium]